MDEGTTNTQLKALKTCEVIFLHRADMDFSTFIYGVRSMLVPNEERVQ